MTGASQQAVQGAAASDPEGKLLLLLFSCSEGLAASRPFPIVRSGSHSFCHLESPPDLRGPSGCGGGCPSKTQLWDGESLTVLPSPDLPSSTPGVTHHCLFPGELGDRGHLNPELSWAVGQRGS